MRERFNRESLVLVSVAAGLTLLQGCQAEKAAPEPTAREVFLDGLGAASITVYPAYVRQPRVWYDDTSAEHLAGFLRGEKLAKVEVTDDQVPITGSWGREQAQMLLESTDSFATDVRDHPIGTDYALLPEYLFGRDGAVGIHCYVLDAEGNVAYTILLNDHHAPFAEAKPRTVDACTRVLIDVLNDSWRYREQAPPSTEARWAARRPAREIGAP